MTLVVFRNPSPVSTPDLSIVVPAFNEAENLAELVDEIRTALVGFSWELLLIDDGSSDGTLAAMNRLRATDNRIRVLRHSRNAGQPAALALGLRAARAPIAATLDADLQNDPGDLPRLLSELERGFDVVSGVRVERHDSWVRKASSRIANAVRNRATDEQVTDAGCSLRVYRADLLRNLPMFDGMHRFLPTLVRWNGGRLTEIAVRHRPRRRGESKYGIGNRLFRALSDLWAVRWMRRRWIDPRNQEELRG